MIAFKFNSNRTLARAFEKPPAVERWRYTAQEHSLVQDYSIWIEAEVWDREDWVPRDMNSDVVVTRSDGSIWTASFFSYENIASLRRNFQESGECLHGRYVWATNMILVDEVTRARVEEIVADLFASGKFESAFDGPHEAAV